VDSLYLGVTILDRIDPELWEVRVSGFSQFLLGMLAGGMVSIPLGPFGIWAIHVFIREGWKVAFVIALGGVLGDTVVVLGYVLGEHVAEYLSPDASKAIAAVFGNAAVRGVLLVVVGIFLLKTARSEQKGEVWKFGKFWTPFVSAISPQNLAMVGITFTLLGIQASSHVWNVAYIIPGFLIGGLSVWMFCIKIFSTWSILRDNLAFILYAFGCLTILWGVFFLGQFAERVWP
jgi:hypothetical protein